MNIESIENALIRKGYQSNSAKKISSDLMEISPELDACLNEWLNNGKETDYISHNMSIKNLMAKYGLNYPAALLSIDWVIKEPEIAIKVINKGVR